MDDERKIDEDVTKKRENKTINNASNSNNTLFPDKSQVKPTNLFGDTVQKD